MNRKFIPLIGIIMFFLIGINQVFGYTSEYFSFPASYILNNPVQHTLEHSSGKYIVTYEDITNSRLVVLFYNQADGGLESTQYIPNPATWYKTNTKVIIIDYNSTNIGIGIVDHDNEPNDRRYFYFYVMNVNSYAYTPYAVMLVNVGAGGGTDRHNEIGFVEHGGNYYFIFVGGDTSLGTYNFIHVVRFIVSTRTISLLMSIDIDAIVDDTTPTSDGGLILVTQGSNTKDLYILFDHNNSGQPWIYKIDLDASTSEYQGRTPAPNRYSNDDKLSNLNGFNGVYDTEDASPYHYIYLYYTWVRPKCVGSQLYYDVVQYIAQYNNSIALANLIDTNEKYYLIDDSEIIEDTTSWALGFSINRTRFWLYTPIDILGNYFVRIEVFQINDWEDMGLTDIDLISDAIDGSNTIPFNMQSWTNILQVQEFISRDFTSQWQFNALQLGYVVFDVNIASYEYDVTLSYTPYETPLYTYKSYTFTLITYRNDIAHAQPYSIFINGVKHGTGVTNYQGIAQLTRLESVSGLYEWSITVYEGSSGVYTEEFNFLYQDSDLPSTDPNTILIPTTITLLINMVPVGVIGLCGLVFGKLGGYFGFITGIMLGAIVCFLGALIPFWGLLLMILGVVGLIIFRPSGSG